MNFHGLGFLPDGCNSSFIALIPKKTNALLLADFHPIRSMNSTLKLLTKVLAIRLKEMMHDLVSPQQSAFIRGIKISNRILLANEVTNMCQSKLSTSVLLSI